MPVSNKPTLAQLIEAFREWVPTVRVRFNEWFEACREEPILLWHTPVIRYATYVAGAGVAALILSFVINLFAPGGPEPVPRARTADFHVICTSCRNEFVINEKFSFDDFPVRCPKCGQETGQHALKCNSPRCHGRWVVPRVDGEWYRCPVCNATLARRE